MYDYSVNHLVLHRSQAELSRDAEHRHALATAVREHQRAARTARTARPALLRRVRHALARRLVATARLIDAT